MKQLFVVDDDEDILFVLQHWFERNNFVVSCFTRSAELFAVIGRVHPDLILLDVNLGNEDGRKICMQLKGDFHLQCPVILISANSTMKQNYRDSQADDFIDKPFNLKTLKSRIDNHINV